MQVEVTSVTSLLFTRITWKVQVWKVMSQGIPKELEFSMKSRIGFYGKVSDEGDIDVVVEGPVGNMKRTIYYFKEINYVF